MPRHQSKTPPVVEGSLAAQLAPLRSALRAAATPEAPTPATGRQRDGEATRMFPPLPARSPQTNLFAQAPVLTVRAQLRPGLDSPLAQTRALLLQWAEERLEQKLPEGVIDGASYESEAPGAPLATAAPTGRPDEFWAMRVNRPDTDVPSRIWSVEAQLGQGFGQCLVGLRVMVNSAGFFPVAAPKVLRTLSDRLGLVADGERLSVESKHIGDRATLERFCDLLTMSERSLPVILVSGRTEEEARALSQRMASRCLGLAHVYDISREMSFLLTDRWDSRLSAFEGAVRLYMPGFDPATATHHAHPLYLGRTHVNRSDDQMVELVLRRAAEYSCRDFHDKRQMPRFAEIKAAEFARASASAAKASAAASANAKQSEVLASDLAAARAALAESKVLQAMFEEDNVGMRQSLALAHEDLEEARAEAASLRARVLTLEARRGKAAEPANAEMFPTSLADVGEWASARYPGRLTVLPRLVREAKSSTFGDVELFYQVLTLLATHYRDARLGIDGAHELFEQRCKDLGVSLQQSLSSKRYGLYGSAYYVRWRGETRPLELHVKNNGNTRRPEACLRIYGFWCDATQMWIAGFGPTHLPVEAS